MARYRAMPFYFKRSALSAFRINRPWPRTGSCKVEEAKAVKRGHQTAEDEGRQPRDAKDQFSHARDATQ